MERRDLTFNSLDEVLADIKALPAEGLTAAGKWTPAENVEHVSKAIGYTVHGFPDCKPSKIQKVLFTTMVKLFGRKMLTMKLSPGIKFPKGMEFFEPEKGVAWDEAVRRLEQNIADAKTKKMTHPSPVAGDLGHEKWTLMHCRHAELHFSFIHPPAA
ncbi:DUF1569 domain-containing protein [Phycisphaeraceae bacterium D3-23]